MIKRIDIFSLFPEVMHPYLDASIIGKARESELIDIQVHNIRDYSEDKHRTTDDEPYGGGGGNGDDPRPDIHGG